MIVLYHAVQIHMRGAFPTFGRVAVLVVVAHAVGVTTEIIVVDIDAAGKRNTKKMLSSLALRPPQSNERKMKRVVDITAFLLVAKPGGH